jgi:acetyltransferase-like isoleucine patch superfamily enzyme
MASVKARYQHEPASQPPAEILNSPRYDLSRMAACGEDVFVSAHVEIRRPRLVCLGAHIAIDSGFYCTTGAKLADYIHIGPYVTVIGGASALLEMRGFNTIGAGCRLLCASDEFLGAGLAGIAPPEYRDRVRVAPIIFAVFASVGSNVVIHPGVTLGQGSVVGSCSLVTKNTEPWTIYKGIPARPWKKRPRNKMIEAARRMGYGPFDGARSPG